MSRQSKQAKTKRVVFRIQDEYMQELSKRAEETGVTPPIFARMLVQESLRGGKESETIDRLDLMEDRFDELRLDMMHFIKEIFIALGHFNNEELEDFMSSKS